MMTASMPDPNDPQTPDSPDPAPVRPPTPPETPEPDEPPGVPPSPPDTIPRPDEKPVQIPPETPTEVPFQPDLPARTAPRASFLAVALMSCIVVSGPAAAQAQNNDDIAKPANPCQAQPDQTDTDDEAEEQATDAPRPKLEDCNGVLTPPETGDRKIEEPPPDTGTTPVIPPEAVPEQPPG